MAPKEGGMKKQTISKRLLASFDKLIITFNCVVTMER